jgi:putative phosphoribosyl transferase
MRVFADRRDGGRALVRRLAEAGDFDVVVGMARGGVIVAAEVARGLALPLKVLVVRKIGAPGNPELAIGAVSAHETLVDERSLTRFRLGEEDLARLIEKERSLLAERAAAYDAAPQDLEGLRVLLVDDGLATGLTARVAIRECFAEGAREVVFAAPVGPPETAEAIEAEEGVQVILAERPSNLFAVGAWYRDFTQTTDEEVIEALHAAADRPR